MAIPNYISKYCNVDIEIFAPLHFLQSMEFIPFRSNRSRSFYASYAICYFWGRMWFIHADKYTQMDLIRSGCQFFISGIFTPHKYFHLKVPAAIWHAY